MLLSYSDCVFVINYNAASLVFFFRYQSFQSKVFQWCNHLCLFQNAIIHLLEFDSSSFVVAKATDTNRLPDDSGRFELIKQLRALHVETQSLLNELGDEEWSRHIDSPQVTFQSQWVSVL